MGRRTIYACKDNYTINRCTENRGSASTLVLEALHCREAGVIGLCL